jgi:hypothetical protein
MIMGHNSPEELLRLTNNFMESRILLSAAELNLFTALNSAPYLHKKLRAGLVPICAL